MTIEMSEFPLPEGASDSIKSAMDRRLMNIKTIKEQGQYMIDNADRFDAIVFAGSMLDYAESDCDSFNSSMISFGIGSTTLQRGLVEEMKENLRKLV